MPRAKSIKLTIEKVTKGQGYQQSLFQTNLREKQDIWDFEIRQQIQDTWLQCNKNLESKILKMHSKM